MIAPLNRCDPIRILCCLRRRQVEKNDAVVVVEAAAGAADQRVDVAASGTGADQGTVRSVECVVAAASRAEKPESGRDQSQRQEEDGNREKPADPPAKILKTGREEGEEKKGRVLFAVSVFMLFFCVSSLELLSSQATNRIRTHAVDVTLHLQVAFLSHHHQLLLLSFY